MSVDLTTLHFLLSSMNMRSITPKIYSQRGLTVLPQNRINLTVPPQNRIKL